MLTLCRTAQSRSSSHIADSSKQPLAAGDAGQPAADQHHHGNNRVNRFPQTKPGPNCVTKKSERNNSDGGNRSLIPQAEIETSPLTIVRH